MDKNFKVRLTVGIGMFIVALVGLYTFHAVPFKIIFFLFSLMSLVELCSFFKTKSKKASYILFLLEVIFLIWGTTYVILTDVSHFWYIILGVPGYDVFAYLSGKLLGGKIFKKSRPFPRISKNKTWEGTVLGLLLSIGMVAILIASRGAFSSDWIYLFCGPLALMGDLFESYLKRRFNVKDSNEILIKNKFFKNIELLVGGSEGHGGFLDRIDSTVFTCTILLIVSSLL